MILFYRSVHLLIFSWSAGKTHYIKNFATEAGIRRRILLICDAIDRAEILRQLHVPPLNPQEELLHIIVGNVANTSELNMLLFELLVFRVIFVGSEVAFLPSELNVFIELESIVGMAGARRSAVQVRTRGDGNHALDVLPFVANFHHQHLSFDIEALNIPEIDYTCPMQVVARYLLALRDHTLDHEDVDLAAVPISEIECRGLLHEYFLADRIVTSPSMRVLDTFARVLADQLSHLSESPFLNVTSLSLTGANITNTRTILVNALIDVSHDFALRSIGTDGAAESTDYVEYMNTMTKWTDSNHLLVSAPIILIKLRGFHVNISNLTDLLQIILGFLPVAKRRLHLHALP